MVYSKRIQGKYVDLRSVTEEDAEYTLAIRQDPEFVKFLPRLDITIEQQRDWIRKQREEKGDYFFLAVSKEDRPIGTLGVYNVMEEISESGRLALKGDALQNMEASMLLFKFSFEVLGIHKITGYVYADNKRAIRFNKKFGCSISRPEPDKDGKMICNTIVEKEQFYEAIMSLEKLLYR